MVVTAPQLSSRLRSTTGSMGWSFRLRSTTGIITLRTDFFDSSLNTASARGRFDSAQRLGKCYHETMKSSSGAFGCRLGSTTRSIRMSFRLRSTTGTITRSTDSFYFFTRYSSCLRTFRLRSTSMKMSPGNKEVVENGLVLSGVEVVETTRCKII